MGAVCSAGMAEGNAELGGMKTLGFSGKLKKENSFVNRKGEAFPDSRSNGQGKKKKKRDNGFSNESNLSTSTPAPAGGNQVPFTVLKIFIC